MTQSTSELLKLAEAFLTSTHLRELGLERRAIDAIFRQADGIVVLPGHKRPMIHVADYLDWIERHTHRDDRVRPPANASRSNGRRMPA